MPAEKGPFDGPRDFTYIKPMKRRVSDYEATSLMVQANVNGFDTGGWMVGFADGRAPWSETRTAMRSGDWFAFRDPSQMWQRVYCRRQVAQEQGIEQLTRHAAETGLLSAMDQRWAAEGLSLLYFPFAFYEDGLFRAFAYAQREALSDSTGLPCLFNATDKVRHAEDIVIYHLQLLDAGLPVRSDDGKDSWLNEPALQGIRRVVERLLATDDWVEIVVAANLVVEPLLARTIYQDVLLRGAPMHRDLVTPVILMEAERDRLRNQAWTEALVDLLLGDTAHGDANLAVLKGWLAAWYDDVWLALCEVSDAGDVAGLSSEEIKLSAKARWTEITQRYDVDARAIVGAP